MPVRDFISINRCIQISVSNGDSPFVSKLTQRDCPRLTHFTAVKKRLRAAYNERKMKFRKEMFISREVMFISLDFYYMHEPKMKLKESSF